jgi:hypothetical protein
MQNPPHHAWHEKDFTYFASPPQRPTDCSIMEGQNAIMTVHKSANTDSGLLCNHFKGGCIPIVTKPVQGDHELGIDWKLWVVGAIHEY